MDEAQKSNITLNLKDGSFSVTGSEDFVSKQTAEFYTLIQNIKPNFNENHISNNARVELQEGQQVLNAPVANKYLQAGVYSIDTETGSVRIHKRIPGSGKAAKMKNVAMVILYAKSNQPITSDEVRVVCEKQACLDKPNFSTVFSKDMEYFIKKGKGSNWTLELSIPGLEAAEKLLEEMLSETK